MGTWHIEARGTFTRDIKWFEIDAPSEGQARALAQAELGERYRVHSVDEKFVTTVDMRGGTVEVAYKLKDGAPVDFHLVDQATEYTLTEDEMEWIDVQLYAIHNAD